MRQKLWAILVIAGILFAQGALAAYACPALVAGAAMETPCDQMDMESAPLCQRHCIDEEQKPHEGSVDASAMPFVAAFCIRMPEVRDHHASRSSPGFAQQAAPPPLILRNCCLRI